MKLWCFLAFPGFPDYCTIPWFSHDFLSFYSYLLLSLRIHETQKCFQSILVLFHVFVNFSDFASIFYWFLHRFLASSKFSRLRKFFKLSGFMQYFPVFSSFPNLLQAFGYLSQILPTWLISRVLHIDD